MIAATFFGRHVDNGALVIIAVLALYPLVAASVYLISLTVGIRDARRATREMRPYDHERDGL